MAVRFQTWHMNAELHIARITFENPFYIIHKVHAFVCVCVCVYTCNTWSDNKVCELIVVKVLRTSLLSTTVVAFRVLPLGS